MEIKRWAIVGESQMTLRDNMTGDFITCLPGQQEMLWGIYHTLNFAMPTFEANIEEIQEDTEGL